MSKRDLWVVRLGPAEWAKFAREPQAGEFELLGSVRRGARIGALAVTPDGRYLQVNGDYVSELDQYQLRRAVRTASKQPSRPRSPHPARRGPAAAPVVMVKRRRLAAPV